MLSNPSCNFGHQIVRFDGTLLLFFTSYAFDLSTDFIPGDLSPRTQILLRTMMQTPRSNADKRGYIYALQLRGN